MTTHSPSAVTAKTTMAEDPCFGAWLASGSPVIAELASACGVSWTLFDMEHGALCEADLLGCLQAAKSSSTKLIVRVPTHDPALIGRILDKGASGIMVPHVETAEQAEALVKAMRYAPEGTRGYSRSVRAYGYGLTATVSQPQFFAQIESALGVRNVEGIAAVDGVDVLFVGPADLRLSLASEPRAPNYEEALRRIVAAAKQHDIELGILVRELNDLPFLLNLGFRHIAVNSDLAVLRTAFLDIVRLEKCSL